MISSENKRKELEHILSSENFVKITRAIQRLRDDHPFVGAIGLLVTYFDRSDNSSAKRLITEFFNDLKDQTSCSEVLAARRKPHSNDEKYFINCVLSKTVGFW